MMNHYSGLPCAALLLVIILCACSKSSPPTSASKAPAQGPSAAGYWLGDIELPTSKLRVGFDLIENGDQFMATFDSFDQGIREMAAQATQTGMLVTVTIDLARGGRGSFAGQLSEDGQTLEGNWSQGPASLPMKMKRGDRATATDPKEALKGLTADELAENKEAAKGIPGEWHGALDVKGQELRLAIQLVPQADGTVLTTLTSVDQGNATLPVRLTSLKGDHVFLDLPGIRGNFHGTLAPDKKKITGRWTQMGNTFPLTFERGAP
jgi:hypothetical protein